MEEKHEWRKSEKSFYTVNKNPHIIEIPPFKFFSLQGKGNPNDPFFSAYIQCLYSLSYTLKMDWKKNNNSDYTVYPLEGIWDLETPPSNGVINKDDLIFKVMIRQPDFVSDEYAQSIIEKVKTKKPQELLDEVKFETITDGLCIQVLHIGSYDTEPESFARMESFAQANNLTRTSKAHREIYISDPRKVQPDKLKTILRFKVK